MICSAVFIVISDAHTLAWNRYKLEIRQPISLKGNLEREDLDKYMSVDVFLPLVSVTGTLVQML
jgi:hypothetical protein